MSKNAFHQDVAGIRHPTHDVNPLFVNRWSPRSMTGEGISDEELNSLFEAARWAPSSYNNQPWRFLYAKRDTPEWSLFFNLMIDFNQSWAKNAAVLLVIVSGKNFEMNQKPCQTHSFDTGAAWMSLCLEGNLRGLVVHGMQGFDYEKARKDLKVPNDFQVEAMAAIGKRGAKGLLPNELQEKEKPSLRKSIEEIAFEGTFKK